MPLRGYKTKTCDVFIVVVHSSTGKHDVTFGLDCNQQLRPKNKNDQQPVVTFKNVSQVDRLVIGLGASSPGCLNIDTLTLPLSDNATFTLLPFILPLYPPNDE